MSGSGKLFVGGNWKMNCSKKQADEIVAMLANGPISSKAGEKTFASSFFLEKIQFYNPKRIQNDFKTNHKRIQNEFKTNSKRIPDVNSVVVDFVVEVVIAPPAIYLDYVKSKVPAGIKVAAQNCSKEASGAFTGEIRYFFSLIFNESDQSCLVVFMSVFAWLIDWLIYWFIMSSYDWLIDWLICCSRMSLFDWLIVWLFAWSIDWLIYSRSSHDSMHCSWLEFFSVILSFCSAEMIKDIGLEWVILGHSERRALFGESDAVSILRISSSSTHFSIKCHVGIRNL